MLVKSLPNIFQNNNTAEITISTTTQNYRHLALLFHHLGKREMLLLCYFYQMTIRNKTGLRKIRLGAFFNFMVIVRKNYGNNFHMVSSIIKRDYKINMSWPHSGRKWALKLGMWQDNISKIYTSYKCMKFMSPLLQADNSCLLPRASPPFPRYWEKIISSSSIHWSLQQWEEVLVSCSVFPLSLIDSALKSSLILKHILLFVPVLNLWHSWGSFQNVGFLQMVDECHPERRLFHLYLKAGAEISLLEKIHSGL